MSTAYSKTLLRKGAHKTHAGHAIHRHAPTGKSVTSDEEQALLSNPGKSTAPPPHGAKMRSE